MDERLAVICWLWSQDGGRTKYAAYHVNILRDMVARHLGREHEFACVTDIPEGIDSRVRIIAPTRDLEAVTIPTWGRGRPQCHRRLALFRRDAADIFGADRIVCIDLDVVIGAPLDPLFAGGEDFRICRGTSPGRSVNGSMWMLRLGSHPEVFDLFTPERAAEAGRLHAGSDQSWIARCLGKVAPTWSAADGVVPWQQRHMAHRPRVLTFPGGLKPWSLAEHGADSFVVKHYRRSPAGRALVLGYGPSLWRDAARAIDRPVDAVIASPEAAAHWPGPILAVADDDDHAERLAAMHGLEPLWCGRSGEGELHAAA